MKTTTFLAVLVGAAFLAFPVLTFGQEHADKKPVPPMHNEQTSSAKTKAAATDTNHHMKMEDQSHKEGMTHSKNMSAMMDDSTHTSHMKTMMKEGHMDHHMTHETNGKTKGHTKKAASGVKHKSTDASHAMTTPKTPVPHEPQPIKHQ